MKFFKLSILVVFVLVLLGSVIPFNKADAQVFTSVCGYDESTNSDILCNYEIEIEEGNNPPAWSTIHINFIFLSSTSDLVGNPSFVKDGSTGDLYNFSPNACNGSSCYQHQKNTNGNGGVVNVNFRWNTSYGVYEYIENILYTVNGNQGGIYATLNANPVNSSSGDVTITFTSSYSGDDCRLYNWDWITSQQTGPILATGSPSGTYNTSIDSDKGYYLSCYKPSFPTPSTDIVIVNKVPLVEPTVELSFDQERGVRDLVEANTTTLTGATHLSVYVVGLPTGESCVLKKNQDGNISELGTFYNNFIPQNNPYSNLGSNNSFYLDCSDPADDTPLLNAKGQLGTLSGPASCIIPVGERYCTNVPLTWNTINPIDGPTTQIINDDEDQVLATGNSGTQQGVTLPYSGGSVTIKAVNYISGYVNVGDSGDAVENEIADRITILTSCAEGSTWNGTACAPNAPAPSDLTASVPPEYLVMVNTPVNFTSTILNQGSGSTLNTFSNKFQIASSVNGQGTIIDIASTPSPMPILAGGASRVATSATHTFTNMGNRSVRACADNTSVIAESNEGNNCSAWRNVEVSNIGSIDLMASAPPVLPVTIGTPISFTSIISNNGNISTGATFYNSFQFATGADGEGPIFPLINSTPRPMPILGGNQAATATSLAQTFTGPARTISVRACADNNVSMVGAITESNEGNNCSSWTNISIGGQSDLVSSLTAPTSVVRGVATSFFATITNQGQGSTVDPFFNLFQTSTEPNGGGTVSDFRTNTTMSPLAAGAHIQQVL